MEWLYRLRIQSFHSAYSLFVTLTLSDEYIGDNVVHKSDLQKLFKRLRKQGFEFKYYAIGEYGTTTGRAHYHILFFCSDLSQKDRFQVSIHDTWNSGFTKIGTVSPASINYVLHYHVRPKFVDDRPTFSLMSKGLGLQRVTDSFLEWLDSQDSFRVSDYEGMHYVFPRYYRKKFNLSKPYEITSVYDYICDRYDVWDLSVLSGILTDLQDLDKHKKFKVQHQEKF